MHVHARSRLYLLLLLLCATAAVAQPAGSSAPNPQALTSAPSKTIGLTVIVTSQSGQPVASLRQSDFRVLDNKVPQSITSFRAMNGSQEPFEVILLIDSVNTPYIPLARARTGIDRFLRANGGHLQYPTALGILTDQGVQLQRGFIQDGNTLATFLNNYMIGLRDINRSNGIYGAAQRFQISMDGFSRLVDYAATRPGRKIILWISPGWPLFSSPALQLTMDQTAIFHRTVALSTELRQSDITVYNINPWGAEENMVRTYRYEDFIDPVKNPGNATIPTLALQLFAIRSGGLVLSRRNISGLLQQCVDESKAYYQLSFEPQPSKRKVQYHSLQVQVTQPGLTARTSTGYYSLP